LFGRYRGTEDRRRARGAVDRGREANDCCRCRAQRAVDRSQRNHQLRHHHRTTLFHLYLLHPLRHLLCVFLHLYLLPLRF
jgi:hypothetical protein